MKHGKKLTLQQKKLLSSIGYEVKCYLVIKNTLDRLTILNIETGQVEEVLK